MCPRDDVDYQGLQLKYRFAEVKSQLDSKLEEVKSEVAELKSDIAEIKCDLADVCKHFSSAKGDVVREDVKSDNAGVRDDFQLHEVKSELAEVKRSLEEKLDAVLNTLREKDPSK